MGNESTKTKSTKAQKPVVVTSGGKTGDDTKHVLFLYKPLSEDPERSSEIMEYFYDALNQVKPVGCVAISMKNAVNLSEHDRESIKNRTSQWLIAPNNVVLLCISANQTDQMPREDFTDDNGKLPSKIFPLCFGSEIPSLWPECYSVGLASLEKIERPNDFEGEGLDTLVAAIRGVE
ncbi:hypothetical protein OS493_035016 [Desmophyllum pertusum]|uniref:Uncharacterized protein n=1 Tax=Desmophyllum pertusum TaxID=174260 RepID=A0A9X0CDX8_9CNID|nr:hypothetical protein OS493_035016 [Desmophyllum pertusum]